MVDDAHGAPHHDVEIFSSASNAPRVRWSADLAGAVVTAIALIALIAVAGTGAELDDDALDFIGTLPGWFRWLAQASYLVAVVYSIVLLVGVAFFASGRLGVVRDMLLAAAAAVASSVLLTLWIDDRWPQIALFDLQQTRTTFPAFEITGMVAIQAAAAPHLTRAVRRIGWTAIIAGPIASILGGVTTISDALGGLLLGLLAASLVRFVFGTTAGLPPIGRVRRGLSELGITVDDLVYDVEQPGPALTLTGTVDGSAVMVDVLGSDAWNSRQLARWWRRAWYQDVGDQYGSDRRQQVEHEALVLLVARQAGAGVPDLAAVGVSQLDDAFLVTSYRDRTFDDLADTEVDEALAKRIWQAVRALHDAGVTHGTLGGRSVWLIDGGEIELADFGDAALHSTPERRWADLAAVLVMLAVRLGSDAAISTARDELGDDGVAELLPMLQTASLTPSLRADAKQSGLKINDLRKQAATAVGVDAPDPQHLTRVSWTSLLMTAFVAVAAYAIIGGLADIGFDTIVDTLSDASWGYVLLGLALAAATNYTDAIALVRLAPKPVPVGITTIQQFAIGFINMAVPSAAGRIATNARYFEKFGISPVTSAASGAITGLLGFGAQIILIVVTIVVGSGSIDLSTLETDGSVSRLLGMAVGIGLVALAVVAAVPALRHWALDKIRGPLSQIEEAFATLRDLRTAVRAFAAAFATELLYGAGLAACVVAMGGSVTLGEALFINVTVSLFAGLMPVPGGIGVSEAGLTAGLTAIGISSEVAVGAVLTWRIVSYYLPPTWGYVSLRWLTKRDYL